ncbi:DUF397 domain-containing protein [Streptomyces sp. NBC_00576]|uniref:DUF397 domain-containing protein n=1 Tax=Streptomyces sp. NBC_00576 TaxID=2903665 RepID=UPI002E804DA6|nr:DUF397 domain-containing protein [Streptomyces sp. NBC_00576]WUB74201.1 DUF397 domain-containing protein [Streptomyces sp. NBC_00576]
MTNPLPWQKSSFSEGGDGNTCVEIADACTHIAIRDSKDPARGTLTFPPRAFATFVEVLKRDTSGTAT